MSHQGVAQSALPRAIRAHERMDLTLADRQIDASKNLLTLDSHPQVLDAKFLGHRFFAFSRSGTRRTIRLGQPASRFVHAIAVRLASLLGFRFVSIVPREQAQGRDTSGRADTGRQPATEGGEGAAESRLEQARSGHRALSWPENHTSGHHPAGTG